MTLVLSVDSKQENRRASFRWLFCCLGSFVFSGAIGVLQKAHQKSMYKEEINQFLLIAFLISAAFSAVLYFINRKRPQPIESGDKRQNIVLGAVSVITGVCVALANVFNMYLMYTEQIMEPHKY